MGLSEVREIMDNRTPAEIDKLLELKINSIDDTVENWKKQRKLLCVIRQTIHSVLDVDEKGISVRYIPQEGIRLGELNDYTNDRDDYDALASFYGHFIENALDVDLNYSAWGMFSEERIKKRDWKWPDRYYFNDPDGEESKDSGLYVIGYKRGGYGQSADLYERLLDYIDTNKLEICGSAYEEYPLNELCITNANNYLMRIMINVE